VIGTLKRSGRFILRGAFNVFLLRQFFMTIPKDLSEAARIDAAASSASSGDHPAVVPSRADGRRPVSIYVHMERLPRPADFLTKQDDYTLALGLQLFQSQHGGNECIPHGRQHPVALPIIVLFFFTQKTFIEGISMTGIKG